MIGSLSAETSCFALQVKKDFQDIVLSARQDEFYKQHMYANFGDIGAAVKSLVDEFQKQSTSSRNINTIEDMQNFVENFSEFSAAQRNAGKHVTLMSELSRLVDARTLMQVGLATRPNQQQAASSSPSGACLLVQTSCFATVASDVMICMHRCQVLSRRSAAAPAT
jgi:hypothetical protein